MRQTDLVMRLYSTLSSREFEEAWYKVSGLEFRDEDFEIATATTEEEVKQLGEAGFTKYDEMKGIHFYRKPKRFRGLK